MYFQLCLLMQVFSVSLYCVCCSVHVVAALFLKMVIRSKIREFLISLEVSWLKCQVLLINKFVSLINVQNIETHNSHLRQLFSHLTGLL